MFPVADAVAERSTPRYRCALTTPDGDDVTVAQVTSVTMHMWDEATGAIRSSINVNNTGGGTLVDGLFTLTLTQGDTAIIDTTKNTELRIMTLDFVLSTGRQTHEVTFYVRNLRAIAA